MCFFAPMTMNQLLCLLLAGVAASGGQFSITAAYANAPADEISIYDYTIVIFAALWSFIFWGDIPDMMSIIGYGIVFAAAFAMFMYNKKKSA